MKTHSILCLAVVSTAVVALVGISSVIQPVRAAGSWYVVSTGDDSNNCLSPGDACASINGVLAKPGFVAGDTLSVGSGSYTGTGSEVVLIDKDVSLSGGWDDMFTTQVGASTIDGENSRRGITVNSGVTASVMRFEIVNGFANRGGGIYNSGDLTLETSTVSSNTASNAYDSGGGIYITDTGSLTLNSSTVMANTASYDGGGIYNQAGTVAMDNSIISENTASWYGGGIVNSFGTLILDNSTVRDNSTDRGGGGVCNSGGHMTLTVSVVSDNIAFDGGAIYNEGTATINNTIINGNSADQGGGIHNKQILDLSNSTISNNTASVYGGGINNWYATATVTNSTISGNTAGNSYEAGGGIRNFNGSLTLNNSTVVGNSTFNGGRGGGIANDGTVTLRNTILASNSASGTGWDCDGVIGSAGYNLIGDTSDCTFTSTTGDLTNINPFLGPLQDNGGPTFTHASMIGSPAINAGNPAGCVDHLGNPLSTDQRGMPRVQRCDIGAFEFQDTILQVFLPLSARDFCVDFFDDFSDPTSGWDVVDDAFHRSEYLDGEFRILSKQSGYFYLFTAPTCSRQNYVVEVDARWSGTPGYSYGLIFGVLSDFSQFYLFDINTDSQQFRILRRDPGEFITLVPFTSSFAINGGTATNHLKVMRNGDQITLEVNGVVLGTWTDGTIMGSTFVGIISSPYYETPISDARFDNFSVSVLPGGSAGAQELGAAATDPRNGGAPGNHRIVIPTEVEWWMPED